MNGEALSPDQMDAIARLPTRDVLYGRLVGMVASPLTGLVTSLGGLIGGLARQLGPDRRAGPRRRRSGCRSGRGGGSGREEAAPAAEAEAAPAADASPDTAPAEDAPAGETETEKE